MKKAAGFKTIAAEERKVILGITGGTGSGKTSALNAIRDLGGTVIDCDAVYHKMVAENQDLRHAIDFAILPCVTCNVLGQRLGHGCGYYDHFLSQYRGGTVLLCREQLLRQEIPVEPHDYPVPWVLTERALYEDGIPAPFG